jgi:hypothetical protein
MTTLIWDIKELSMKNRNSKLNVALLIVMFTFAGPVLAQAGDYYVSPNGAASWANCQSATPLSGTAACSLSTANSNAVSGDTIYLRAGTYTSGIAPSRSGTAAARITYRNYGGEVATLTASTAISLNGKNYITVTGINAGPCLHCVSIKNGNYNIISYGTFGPTNSPTGSSWELNVVDTNSQYNWLHHNTFHDFGSCQGTPPNGNDVASVLDIGYESTADTTKYNLIEDNAFYHGGHHVVAIQTGFNTFRNNYVHNEGWSSGAGNRTLYLNNLVSSAQADVGHNVIEGNRLGFGAKPCDAVTVGIVAMSTNYNLFRYNNLFHGNANGLGTSAYGNPNSQGSYNHIYSNTIFNTGLGNLLTPTLSADTYSSEHTGISFFNSANKGNVVRNNLFYKTVKAYGGSTSAQNIANDWDGNTKGDPLFVNASTTPGDPNNGSLPNLNLQSTSPAIDKGGALTTVAAADPGSGASLVVADSLFFQDGSYAPPGTVQADWIAVGTVGNIVQISSINHSTNTITLANSISRQSGDPVWLYKKSDGVRVLYGSAPDAGANEYSGIRTPLPSPPTNLQVTTPGP